MESKIRIKVGPIEVEYEGSETFLKKELPDLIRTVSEIYKTANLQGESENTGNGNEMDEAKNLQLSTNSIAAKLSVNSGPELVTAAAAHLTFVKNKKVFSRKELLTEMQTASSYYKTSYGANLTNILATLIKTNFNEPSSGNYALTTPAEKKLRPKLA